MGKEYYRVLTIAGSDSSGGAGIQADLKTISALGCYGLSVITALTAQNTQGVISVHAVPAPFVGDQLEAVLSDMGVNAVKIGMLYSADIIETIAGRLKKYSVKNIVLDPVMTAQSGDRLLQDKAMDAIKDSLMPLATVFTPNIPEASEFLGCRILTREDMRKAAVQLASSGAKSILLKGGHLEGEDSTDLLYICSEDRFIVLKAPRIITKNNHGTGCTLSSAVASFLARGHSLEKAVKKAKEYLTAAISAGAEFDIGGGHGPVHHFHKFW